MPVTATLYDLLGVTPSCSLDELRSAYRRRAREHHPDVSGRLDAGRSMAALNDAWRVLSDPGRRQEYDASIEIPIASPTQPPPQSGRARRNAWVAGVQAQIVRLSRLAGRSAVQTLLLRGPTAERAVYEEVVELIVDGLLEETEARVRAARAAGAAPLDLGVASTLVGIRSLSDRVRRQSSLGVTPELVMTAQLLDRMWDILAHELPITLTTSLGGNPQVARRLSAH